MEPEKFVRFAEEYVPPFQVQRFEVSPLMMVQQRILRQIQEACGDDLSKWDLVEQKVERILPKS